VNLAHDPGRKERRCLWWAVTRAPKQNCPSGYYATSHVFFKIFGTVISCAADRVVFFGIEDKNRRKYWEFLDLYRKKKQPQTRANPFFDDERQAPAPAGARSKGNL